MPQKTKKTKAGKTKRVAKPVEKRGQEEKERTAKKAKRTKKEPVKGKEISKTTVEKKEEKKEKYFSAVGRRKTSVARVRLFTAKRKGILVNGKPYKEYFPTFSLAKKVEAPLEKLSCEDKFGFSIRVKGGGISGQAEACRHGISRALILMNPYFKKRLRKAGFLTRDPRMRERKKFGLKRARKAPQWSKR